MISVVFVFLTVLQKLYFTVQVFSSFFLLIVVNDLEFDT